MKILLVIDLQKEFADESGRYVECLEYIKNHSKQYDRVYATIFRQDEKKNPNYARKLRWGGCKDADISSLEFFADGIIIKHGYSLCLDSLFSENDEIYVMGCDSDACVLAVCFELWDKGLNFYVLADYIYTSGDADNGEVIRIMKRNFGDAVRD